MSKFFAIMLKIPQLSEWNCPIFKNSTKIGSKIHQILEVMHLKPSQQNASNLRNES